MKNLIKYMGIAPVLLSITTEIDVYAAEANPSAEITSGVEVQISPGMLTLDKVANFNFGTSSVEAIANGDVVLPVINGNVTNTSATDNIELNTQISDYRGANSDGWSLRLDLGELKNSSNTEIILAQSELNIIPEVPEDFTGNAPVGLSIIPGNGEVELLSANSGKGLRTNEFTFDGTTTNLTIKQQDIISGRYQADLTWSLYDAYSPQQ